MKGSGYSWSAYIIRTRLLHCYACVHDYGHVNASWHWPHPLICECDGSICSTKESQAYSLPLRNQSWVSRVISIARSIHYSGWKEAITVSFVHREFIKKRRRPRWSANVIKIYEQSISTIPLFIYYNCHEKPNGLNIQSSELLILSPSHLPLNPI